MKMTVPLAHLNRSVAQKRAVCRVRSGKGRTLPRYFMHKVVGRQQSRDGVEVQAL